MSIQFYKSAYTGQQIDESISKIRNSSSSSTVAGNIAIYDSNGNLKSGTPVADNDVATKSDISNPNLLINGDFRVNQRGQNSYTGSGTRLYTVDRWAITSSANVTSINQNSLSVSFGGQYQAIEQKIEDFEKLKGKTLTLSCKISNTTIGSGGLYLRYNSGNTNGSSQITSDGIYKLTFTLSSGATQLAIQIFSGAGSGQQYSFDLEYMKLEVGEVATPFSPRPYAEELALCQRYYQNLWTTQCQFFARNSTSARCMYRIEMRTRPTVTAKEKIGLFSIKDNVARIQTSANLYINTSLSNEHALFIAPDNFTNLTTGELLQSNTNDLIATLDAEIY